MERRGAAEVSREGQMDARERLIQELEGSAKRAQQVWGTREELVAPQSRKASDIKLMPIVHKQRTKDDQ